jgi:hypothetical protein
MKIPDNAPALPDGYYWEVDQSREDLDIRKGGTGEPLAWVSDPDTITFVVTDSPFSATSAPHGVSSSYWLTLGFDTLEEAMNWCVVAVVLELKKETMT